MTEKTRHFTDAEFDAAVLEPGGIALVDFWAPWCPPCRALGPVIDSLAQELGDAATVGKINVDESPATAQRFGISSIPTVLLFQNGELRRKFVGVQPANVYLEAIRALEPAVV